VALPFSLSFQWHPDTSLSSTTLHLYKFFYQQVASDPWQSTELLLHFCQKSVEYAGHQWLMPVILATQQAEIRRIEV
jgi:hypothetical protein